MADTVTVFNGNTGGTNYTVASDEVQVGGTMALSQVQYVKLVDGTLNGTTPVPGTAAGLGVVPRADVQKFTVDPITGFTTVAYTAGDQMGTLITVSTSAARVTGGTGTILGVEIVDNNTTPVIGSIDVVFFSDTVSLPGDNLAFNLTTALDRLDIIDIVSLNYAMSFTSFRFARLMGLSIPYKLTAQTLYAALITRTTLGVFSGTNTLSMNVYVALD